MQTQVTPTIVEEQTVKSEAERVAPASEAGELNLLQLSLVGGGTGGLALI
jgi:DNA transposition AAA+ family ATPase